MAKAKKSKQIVARKNPVSADLDYFVYWRSGLKSRVHGGPLQAQFDYYKHSASRIVAVDSGKEIFVQE